MTNPAGYLYRVAQSRTARGRIVVLRPPPRRSVHPTWTPGSSRRCSRCRSVNVPRYG